MICSLVTPNTLNSYSNYTVSHTMFFEAMNARHLRAVSFRSCMYRSLYGRSNNSPFSLAHNVLMGSEKAVNRVIYKSIYRNLSLMYMSALSLWAAYRKELQQFQCSRIFLEKLTFPQLVQKFIENLKPLSFLPSNVMCHWTIFGACRMYSTQVGSLLIIHTAADSGSGCRRRYSDSLRVGRSGGRIPVRARYSASI
jgi:hypothetical protein